MRNPKEIQQYAQARANETGRPYIVTTFGHCFMDCAANRKLALDPKIGEGIAVRVFPKKRIAKESAARAARIAKRIASLYGHS